MLYEAMRAAKSAGKRAFGPCQLIEQRRVVDKCIRRNVSPASRRTDVDNNLQCLVRGSRRPPTDHEVPDGRAVDGETTGRTPPGNTRRASERSADGSTRTPYPQFALSRNMALSDRMSFSASPAARVAAREVGRYLISDAAVL